MPHKPKDLVDVTKDLAGEKPPRRVIVPPMLRPQPKTPVRIGEQRRNITVRELIALLQSPEVLPDAIVILEGCDCTGDANGVIEISDTGGAILLMRGD